MPVNPVSQLIVVRHAYSIPSVSRASISVSGIRCPDDLRERTYGTASGISDEHHLEPCRYAPNGHAMLTIPAPRGAIRRDGRADAISGRRCGMDGVRRCRRSWMMRRLNAICVSAQSAGKNMANWDGVTGRQEIGTGSGGNRREKRGGRRRGGKTRGRRDNKWEVRAGSTGTANR